MHTLGIIKADTGGFVGHSDDAQRRQQERALRAELEAFPAGAPALDADRARARESLAMLGAADG